MIEEDTIERDEVARKNRDALFALIAEHRLFIPRRDLDRWRPTRPTDGTVDGFFDLGDMMCIATDGIQAYFLLPDDKTYSGRRTWIGHIQHFHWSEPIVTMVPYVDEKGQQKFFKSVKDKGAPSPLFSRPKLMRELKARKPKKESKSKKLKRMLDEI